MPQKRDLVGAARRFLEKTYAADYAGFVLLLTCYFLVQFLIEPFHRLFSLDDRAIQYPHADPERVPVSWLFIYAGALPLVTLALYVAAARPGWHTAHVTVLGLFVSLILTSFLTDVVKNSVGRPRPDLLARCVAAVDTPRHELVSIAVCTQEDHHTLHDGWRSFPSGHSSFAFSGLGYLAMFLAGQMHVFRPRTDLARVLLALGPLVGAALIAISRCEDYRHDVYDVTVGSFLGLLVAYSTYRRYFPGLRSSRCHVPYAKPLDALKSLVKNRDEEEGIISSDDDSERVPLQERARTMRTRP